MLIQSHHSHPALENYFQHLQHLQHPRRRLHKLIRHLLNHFHPRYLELHWSLEEKKMQAYFPAHHSRQKARQQNRRHQNLRCYQLLVMFHLCRLRWL